EQQTQDALHGEILPKEARPDLVSPLSGEGAEPAYFRPRRSVLSRRKDGRTTPHQGQDLALATEAPMRAHRGVICLVFFRAFRVFRGAIPYHVRLRRIGCSWWRGRNSFQGVKRCCAGPLSS